MTENPLLAIHALPRFSQIHAAHIEPAVDQVLRENRAALVTLCRIPSTSVTWDNMIQPLEALENKLNRVWSPICHLNSVQNSAALRQAYSACLPKISEYSTELGQNAQLFKGYQAVRNSAAFADLSHAQQQAIAYAIRDFKLAGVDLATAQQARFKAIKQRLSELANTFQENLLDATQAFTFATNNLEDLAGLPESSLALAQQSAQDAKLSGWRLTLDFPVYHAVMRFADNASLRETFYQAYQTRASDQGPHAGRWDNSHIMDEILALRDELSQLLGFDNYAEYSLVTKMANSSAQVMDFLHDLATKSKAVAEREYQALTQYATEKLGYAGLNPWDILYVSEQYKQQQFAFSQEMVKPYFPVDRVLQGLFRIVQKLFGIRITPCAQDVWHATVRFFQIENAEQQVLGHFYLDLYARANKRGGAWMADCVGRKADAAGVQLPVAFLTCNFTPPVQSQPTLLTHDEMTTLFHEFGHGLHHMLTKVDVLSVSGINGVAWDAVELPSQFLENWCWEKPALAQIAGHWETGAPLPDDLFDKLRASKTFQAGMQMLRQLEFALFDFRLHLDYAEKHAIYQVLNAVREQIAVVKPPAYARFAHGFAHIFAGGYGAGYYSYKWAEVLSSDAFARFEQEGVFSATVGGDFLRHILEQGGARNAMELFVRFRGREPIIDALLRHSGVLA